MWASDARRPSALRVGRLVLGSLLVAAVAGAPLAAQERVERNVVYGMHSGLALLMDVHHPAEPNGVGLVYVWGSGFHLPSTYDAPQLKDRGVPPIYLDAGYTVFVINHRAAPRFRYPAGVEDAQRAVRFIRHHADRYGIDATRLAGWGGSSGAYMVSMLGALDGTGDPDDPDPVNRESAKLQAVIARAAPTDLLRIGDAGFHAATHLGSFIGAPPQSPRDPLYREASPITYVTPDDPPFMLVHGDRDETVPFRQSELMLEALEAQGVDARLIRIEGGDHGANDAPETVRWLNQRVLSPARARAIEPLVDAHARVREAARLAQAGDIEGALSGYREAVSLAPGISIRPGQWNALCWNGALRGRAADVMFACERAIELAPSSGPFRDSRGLARALTGDPAGAITDFGFFVEQLRPGHPTRVQREEWIAALRAGRNPFTPDVLERLRR